MNKQELITKIKYRVKLFKEKSKDTNSLDWSNYEDLYIYLESDVLPLLEELNEPSREECRLIANEYNVCSCCSYNMNNLIEEIVVGCDTEDFCDCGRAVVHQIFWTDKYMNYCPNCGAKIKRGKSDE